MMREKSPLRNRAFATAQRLPDAAPRRKRKTTVSRRLSLRQAVPFFTVSRGMGIARTTAFRHVQQIASGNYNPIKSQL